MTGSPPRLLVALLALLVGRLGIAQDTRRWQMLHANELQTPFTTIRIGMAVLSEIASYNQDNGSRQQLATLTGDTVAPGGEDLRSSSRANLRAPSAVKELSDPGELVTAG